MNRVLLAAFILLAACAGDEPLGAAPEPRSWKIVPGAPVAAAEQRHDDIFFLDERLGWIATAVQGQIHRTVDGGATWETLVTDHPVLFRAIGFVTPELGWVGNLNRFTNPSADSVLWETRDGGRTWTDITSRIQGPRPAGICGLWVLDRHTIFGVGRFNGPAIFIRSTDGGTTWTSRDLSHLATSAVDVHFRDRLNGFIVAGYSPGGRLDDAVRTVILRTRDGGDSWERVFTGSRTSTWGWKIHFTTPAVAYVAQDGLADGLLITTADGGETWREIAVGEPEAWFQGIGFASPDTGWIASDESLFATVDGGDTWSRTNFGERINRFRFLPNGDGFAVGAGVYRYAR